MSFSKAKQNSGSHNLPSFFGVNIMSEEEFLTEEEIDEVTKFDHRLYGSELEKARKTIEHFDKELKTIEGLEKFIQEGVLVTPDLILAASPDDFRLGIYMRAIGSTRYTEEASMIVNVHLSVPQLERLMKILPKTLKAARLLRDRNRLRKKVKDSSGSRSRRY